MKIFVKNSVSKHHMQKDIAPVSARNELNDNLRFENNNLKKSKGVIDVNEAMKNKKKWQDSLDNSCPENLDAPTKNAMWKKAKMLKDEFTVGMLSRDELHPVSTYTDKHGVPVVVVNEEKMQSANTVQRERAWDTKNGDKIREYKNIMRHLNPDNPNASDIEKFRPRRGI
jgi:hypothetical protein